MEVWMTPASSKKGYVGWELIPWERRILLNLILPIYPRVIAHHCTLAFGVDQTYPLPTATSGLIVGETVAEGVQALILKINNTVSRPTGGIYHITWSLAPGVKPVHSNHVIATHGWQSVDPVGVKLEPKWFGFGQAA
jgi:hypothetical protein